jgi:processive 1,2-diacylglycerol beta-glucosyltransferase
MTGRVVFLTAGFGEGHNAAARALGAAADEALGPGAAQVVDVFALARPRLNTITRRSYLSLINRAPRVWSSVYAWLDRSPHATAFVSFMRRELRTLEDVIARARPEVLCSTYPIYAFMLAALARRTGRSLPPHFNVVTDSITINSLWWRAPCAGWFVPNEDSAAVLRGGDVSSERVHVLGFPVAPFFADQAGQLAPPALHGGGGPRVLYIINSGTRNAAETARHLLRQTDLEVTCTVGRNDRLRAELLELAAPRSRPTRILGWTEEIPRLLMTHHVVISKAGGATTQEAIAARCPMIVNQIVPGQEEGNYELLRRHRIGALAETPQAVIAELQRAFANNAEIWRSWRTTLDGLARPNAAREIVRAILPSSCRPASCEREQPALNR